MTPGEKLYILRSQIELDMERYLEEGFTMTELAAVYASNCMFIYRQLFNDVEYDKIMETMYTSRGNVRKIDLFS